MKTLSLFLLIFLAFNFMLWGQTATPPANVEDADAGTSDNPYEIATLNNLYWIAAGDTLWSSHFIQTADIDASDTSSWDDDKGWFKIGNSTTKFTGVYDGQGYSISNLFIDRSSASNIGLFGYTQGAELKGIILINVDFVGDNAVGGLVGQNFETDITMCMTTGFIVAYTNGGGLVGYNTDSEINNSFSRCNVSASFFGAGGLIGQSTGEFALIDKCYSTGTVGGGVLLGGLIGASSGGSETENSFWDRETSGQTTSSGGTGKNTSVMKDIDTYTDTSTTGLDEIWDFVDIWAMYSHVNDGYPIFRFGVRPLPALVIYPPHESIDIPVSNLTFEWEYNTDGPAPDGYFFAYWKTGDSQPAMTDLDDDTEYPLAVTLDLDTEYSWQVIPYVTKGSDKVEALYCPTWTFTTQTEEDPPLPVELSAFTAQVTADMAVNLQWRAETETNMLGYNVYRSLVNSLADAFKINTSLIDAHNSSTTINYSYIDNAAMSGQIYYYWLQPIDMDLTYGFHGPLSVTVEYDDGSGTSPNVVRTELLGAYPNPFNPATAIQFGLAEGAEVTITIYNSRGQRMQTLVDNQYYPRGFYSEVWNSKDIQGRQASSGIYFYKMVTSQGYEAIKKMVLMK